MYVLGQLLQGRWRKGAERESMEWIARPAYGGDRYLSGGSPLVQPEFERDLVTRLDGRVGIHT